MKHKKLTLFCTAVVLALSTLLTGCGQKTSDTVRWFNASYAILTQLNHCDYTVYGGMAHNSSNQASMRKMLDSDWGVTDRDSADENLDWVLEEGHRAEYVEIMSIMGEIGLEELAEDERIFTIAEVFNMDARDAALANDWYLWYEEYGGNAIDAWDYCRAMNLCSFYYIADYYTKEEALDKSLEIAKEMQPLFDSWDDLVDSYLRGYEFWMEESSDDRRDVYEDLLDADDNPYAVDYHTDLTKDW